VLEGLFEEMRANPAVVVIGEDVGAAGGVFLQTEGLFEAFGPARVIDTPISEAAILGIATGAAMTGLRPVVEVMFGDFMTLVMDQLVNQAAKVRYISAGGFCAPLVLRTAIGVGGNLGPQHSQSFHAWVAHIPGLKVVMPATARDAKGLIKAAIRDDDPVVFFENRALYNLKGPVPDGDYVIPLGIAEVKRAGTDVTIVAVGAALQIAAKAARWPSAGSARRIVDPRTWYPRHRDDPRLGAEDFRPSSSTWTSSFGVTGEWRPRSARSRSVSCADRRQSAGVPVPFARSLEPLSCRPPTGSQADSRHVRQPPRTLSQRSSITPWLGSASLG
jgi:pyruvate dehydrogenase E1 component beta subunit